MSDATMFHPGDRVIVDEEGLFRCPHGWNEWMESLVGKTVTIEEVLEGGGYRVEEDDGKWTWTDCCFIRCENNEMDEGFKDEFLSILSV